MQYVCISCNIVAPDTLEHAVGRCLQAATFLQSCSFFTLVQGLQELGQAEAAVYIMLRFADAAGALGDHFFRYSWSSCKECIALLFMPHSLRIYLSDPLALFHTWPCLTLPPPLLSPSSSLTPACLIGVSKAQEFSTSGKQLPAYHVHCSLYHDVHSCCWYDVHSMQS